MGGGVGCACDLEVGPRGRAGLFDQTFHYVTTRVSQYGGKRISPISALSGTSGVGLGAWDGLTGSHGI